MIVDHLLVVTGIEATLAVLGTLRIGLRHAAAIKADVRLLLVHILLLVTAALRRITEQELDEATAHVGRHPHRLTGLRGG